MPGLDGYNVKDDYGAVGDGGNNDGPAIQAAIDDAAAQAGSRGPILFPHGEYRVNSMLTVPIAAGLRFVGVGNAGGPAGHIGSFAPHALQSVLIWRGEAGGTLLKTAGAYLLSFEHMVLGGRAAGEATRAGILLHQDWVPGHPGGRSLFTNCTFRDADIGIRFDHLESGSDCADNTFVHCGFYHCGTGLRAESKQVVNNTFLTADFSSCDIGIDQVRGGDLRIYGGAMSGFAGQKLLHINGGGENAQNFVLSGIRLEISDAGPILLEADYEGGQAGPINVDITGVTWVKSGYWDGEAAWAPLLKLGNAVNATIRQSYIRGPLAEMQGANPGYGTTLVAERCRFHHDPATHMILVGDRSHWKTIDCTDYAGNPLTNTGTWNAAAAPQEDSVVAADTPSADIAGEVTGNMIGTFQQMTLDGQPVFQSVGVYDSLQSFRDSSSGIDQGNIAAVIPGVPERARGVYSGEEYVERLFVTIAVQILAPADAGQDDHERMDEAQELASRVRTALLSDRTRGGLCDLIEFNGQMLQATEITGAVRLENTESNSAINLFTLPVQCGWIVPTE